MSTNPQDFTHPEPPNDIPEGSPLMKQAFSGFSLPWPRKPTSAKPKGGKPGPRTSRSGVHRLGRQILKKKNY